MGKVSKKKVEESLKEQLRKRGALTPHFEDLVNDYMGLVDIKNALEADIKERGVTYKDKSSVGVEMMKNNPSVKELVMVNRQMLAMLKELKISTDIPAIKEVEEDEL